MKQILIINNPYGIDMPSKKNKPSQTSLFYFLSLLSLSSVFPISLFSTITTKH